MTDILTPQHLQRLTQVHGIDPAVIEERCYRSIAGGERFAELRRLGYSVKLARVSDGLLLPVHTPDGRQPLTFFRPDTPPPDTTTGRPRKYLLPTDSGVRIDSPPRCHPALSDPAIPLWVTEGLQKEDSLASRGATVIGLLGVWGFKGKNPLGGVTVLADLDYIALNAGREVRIVYDNDVMVNPKVQAGGESLPGLSP